MGVTVGDVTTTWTDIYSALHSEWPPSGGPFPELHLHNHTHHTEAMECEHETPHHHHTYHLHKGGAWGQIPFKVYEPVNVSLCACDTAREAQQAPWTGVRSGPGVGDKKETYPGHSQFWVVRVWLVMPGFGGRGTNRPASECMAPSTVVAYGSEGRSTLPCCLPTHTLTETDNYVTIT